MGKGQIREIAVSPPWQQGDALNQMAAARGETIGLWYPIHA